MGPVVERWLIRASVLAYDMLGESDKANILSQRDVADTCIPYLNEQERAFLVNATMRYRKALKARQRISPKTLRRDAVRPCYMKILEHAANQMDKRLQTKAKTQILQKQLISNRDQSIIFYLSSWHQTPAKGHKDLQGKIYVDRFWRSTLNSTGNSSIIPAVQYMIDRRKIMTVQEVTQGPYWLIFRPYCRHYLVPVPTLEVLGSMTDRQILMNHPEARMHVHRTMDDRTRAAKYIQRRAKVFNKIKDQKK